MTNELVSVYIFRFEGGEPGRGTVVCAAPSELVVRAFGGGGHHDQDGLCAAFGGNAVYRSDETGQTYLAVWGSRYASRFRSALRRKAAIALMREPPPARLISSQTTPKRPPASAQRGID